MRPVTADCQSQTTTGSRAEAVKALQTTTLKNTARLPHIISQDGIIIRIAAESIRVCSRPSKGVTVMKVGEGDKVVTVARVPHEVEEEAENGEESAETEAEETTEE